MEQKLAEFRARRRRQVFLQTTRDAINKVFSVASSSNENETKEEVVAPEPPIERRVSITSISSDDTFTSDTEQLENENEDDVWFGRVQKVLGFLLWVTVLALARQLGLALAYLLISALCLVYFSTRTRARRPGELSAYSVFNPNCERIDGTLTAEQFEREIRYGALR